MDYRQLGNSELTVSAVGLGCVTFGREIGREDAFAVLDHAASCGITLLDTAAAYGGGASEALLGDWLQERHCRDRFVVATKVGAPLSRARILASADESLRRLRTDRIDLFQLHAWNDGIPLEETIGALDFLVRSGKVRCIGCSNFSAEQLRRALELQRGLAARMESVQPIYNLVHRDIEEELLPFCAENRVGVITYSPLGAGFLAGKYRPDQAVPAGTRFDVIPGHRDLYFSPRGFEIAETLRREAAAVGRTPVALALEWVFRQPGPTSVLIGARSPRHIDQALDARRV